MSRSIATGEPVDAFPSARTRAQARRPAARSRTDNLAADVGAARRADGRSNACRERAATYFGDRIGVVDGEKEFTYRAFAERSHRLANALVDLGVAPGDRVSFLTYNTHHLLEAYYGVL